MSDDTTDPKTKPAASKKTKPKASKAAVPDDDALASHDHPRHVEAVDKLDDQMRRATDAIGTEKPLTRAERRVLEQERHAKRRAARAKAKG